MRSRAQMQTVASISVAVPMRAKRQRRNRPEPSLGEFAATHRLYARGAAATVSHRCAYSVSMACICPQSAELCTAEGSRLGALPLSPGRLDCQWITTKTRAGTWEHRPSVIRARRRGIRQITTRGIAQPPKARLFGILA
jgi:hypothetical protein